MQSAASKRVSVYLESSGQQNCSVLIRGAIEYSANAKDMMAMEDVLRRITDTQANRKDMTGPQKR
jgi:hypothetical protein